MTHARVTNGRGARVIRLLWCAMVVFAVVGADCQSPVRPKVRYITGVVRYPDDKPVSTAKVFIGIGPVSTFADTLGRYAIAAPPDSDMVTLWARDGYAPGQSYIDSHYGFVRIVVGRQGAVTDIILDHVAPI